jgi:hypothetical protein
MKRQARDSGFFRSDATFANLPTPLQTGNQNALLSQPVTVEKVTRVSRSATPPRKGELPPTVEGVERLQGLTSGMRVCDRTGQPVGYFHNRCEDGALISALFGRRVLWLPEAMLERVSGGELFIARNCAVPNELPTAESDKVLGGRRFRPSLGLR